VIAASPTRCWAGRRLLIVAEDEALLARLDRMLWDQGAASFLPHGSPAAATMRASRSCCRPAPTRPNLARNMLIADGEWREAALTYDRAFYLFDNDTLEGARLAWKLLPAGRRRAPLLGAGRGGKWVRRPDPCRAGCRR
jgi:DNA polymerase-3 subunit chi